MVMHNVQTHFGFQQYAPSVVIDRLSCLARLVLEFRLAHFLAVGFLAVGSTFS